MRLDDAERQRFVSLTAPKEELITMRKRPILAFVLCSSLGLGGVASAQYQYPPAQTPSAAPAPAAQPVPPATDVAATPPPPPEKKFAVEFTTLNLMKKKGLITPEEYDSAMRDMGESVGAKAGDSLSLMLSKFSVTFYGFAELDFIHDSTQVLNEVQGNAAIPLPTTYAGSHDRLTVGIRNSRLGFRVRSPEWHHIRVSGNLEFDALGNQVGTTEAQTFTNAAIRVRHYNLKIETPIVDILAGQFWSLYGWQSFYFPATVEIQGVPNELFHRDAQLRISKTIKTAPVNIEFAAAMTRAPQRDAGVPEGQFGARLIVNKWKGMQTINSTGTSLTPLSLGFSATVRHFRVNEFKAPPSVNSSEDTGWGVHVGGFVPLVPATETRKSNSLALNGEYSYSKGVADQYVGLTGGAANPALPAAMPGGTPPVFTPNIDNGLLVFDAMGNARLIQWQTFLVGIQYYLPINNGKVWIAGAYSRGTSNNTSIVPGTLATTRKSLDWADANLFWDAVAGLRLGVEYSYTRDTYNNDGATKAVAENHRIQGSIFYIF
jgi:hypothetical protein